MIVNQANLHGLTVGYSTAFNRSFDITQSNHQKVATVVPSSTGEQDYKWLGQMPGMREWIGEREIQALAAYDYLIKNKKFEMTLGVPREDIEDDKYGVYTAYFSNMGEAAALHPDELVFDAMMNGFREKCYDGLSYFNEAHKVGGETYSNRSNEKLSRESYMKARSAIMSIRGDKGKSLKLVPDLLVVSPAEEEMARLILEADQIDGTTNVLKGTAKLLVEPSLAANPHYWFLLCTNRFLKPFIYQLRKKIKFVSLTKDTDENVFLRDEYLYGADGRSNAGYGFWQMAYGSTGEVEAQG
nr:MAG TPA: major capsid protein [Caudoviricetes sp.]